MHGNCSECNPYWKRHWHMKPLGNCSNLSLELLWNCPEAALELLWYCPELPLKTGPDNASKLLWKCSNENAALGPSWNCTETAPKLLRNCSETAPSATRPLENERNHRIALLGRLTKISQMVGCAVASEWAGGIRRRSRRPPTLPAGCFATFTEGRVRDSIVSRGT